MVGNAVGQPVEPEMGDLGEHLALAGDAVGQDAVERRDAVAGDEQQGVPQIEHLADLAALHLRHAGQLQPEQRNV